MRQQEGRKIWHQLCGANYYAGTRQFLEAEKTIRIKSLIKFSHFNMAEIKNIFKENQDFAKSQVILDATALLESTDTTLALGAAIQEDVGILYYVIGYIARKIKKQEKCVSCHALAVKNDLPLTVNMEYL